MSRTKKVARKYYSKAKDSRKESMPKGKEVEVNLKDNQLNAADLPDSNDSEWYTKNNRLALDAATVMFSDPLGTERPRYIYANTSIAQNALPMAESGICVMRWIPTIGKALNETSPITTATRNLYSYMRYFNGGRRNYEAQDFMMYLLAMDSVYIVHELGVRIYGLVKTNSYLNKYMAKRIVQALGWNYEDVVSNLADFRYSLNALAVRAQSLAVPSDIEYFTRHRWLCAHVFKDSDTVKAQMYVFNPMGVYMFAEGPDVPSDDTNKANGLRYVDLYDLLTNYNVTGAQRVLAYPDQKSFVIQDTNPMTGITVKSFVAGLSLLIDKIMSSQSGELMNGDVVKAFGLNNLYRMNTISEDYVVTPVYKAEVLSQIENASITPISGLYVNEGNPVQSIWSATPPGKWSDLDITQTTNIGSGFIQQPNLRMSYAGSQTQVGLQNKAYGYGLLTLPKAAVLNMHKDDPSVGELFVATRFSAICGDITGFTDTASGGVTVTAPLLTFGTELMVSAYMCYNEFSATVGQPTKFVMNQVGYALIDENGNGDSLLAVFNNSKFNEFDWHFPTISTFCLAKVIQAQQTAPTFSGAWITDMRDIDNYAYVQQSQLVNLNEAAILSELDSQYALKRMTSSIR